MTKQHEAETLVDHLFRREAGRIVATLTRVFGVGRLELAEDVVQETLLKALQQWPYAGIPENPSAWIMQVSRNHALDILRREKNLRSKTAEVLRESPAAVEEQSELFLEREIKDDQLRMMFTCCDAGLTTESQVALVLKTLCGFSAAEIARAFLTTEETINKRLVRARQKLRDGRKTFEIPSGNELSRRLDAVLQTLYLLFNEGYNASHGEELVRKDLCDEAIRLAKLLGQHPSGNTGKTHALIALMLLHTARFPARTKEKEVILLLKDQDRSLWDKNMIVDGLNELDLSAEGEEITEYHLQAGIVACHCLAASYDETDWSRILTLYDLLVALNDSPVVLLNRAIAISKVSGHNAGIKAVEEIKNQKHLERYYLLHAVLGEFQMALGRFEEAAQSYRKALELTQARSEQIFLASKLELLKQNLN